MIEEDIIRFKEKLEDISLQDLRNDEIRNGLIDIRIILGDLFSLIKFKYQTNLSKKIIRREREKIRYQKRRLEAKQK